MNTRKLIYFGCLFALSLSNAFASDVADQLKGFRMLVGQFSDNEKCIPNPLPDLRVHILAGYETDKRPPKVDQLKLIASLQQSVARIFPQTSITTASGFKYIAEQIPFRSEELRSALGRLLENSRRADINILTQVVRMRPSYWDLKVVVWKGLGRGAAFSNNCITVGYSRFELNAPQYKRKQEEQPSVSIDGSNTGILFGGDVTIGNDANVTIRNK